MAEPYFDDETGQMVYPDDEGGRDQGGMTAIALPGGKYQAGYYREDGVFIPVGTPYSPTQPGGGGSEGPSAGQNAQTNAARQRLDQEKFNYDQRIDEATRRIKEIEVERDKERDARNYKRLERLDAEKREWERELLDYKKERAEVQDEIDQTDLALRAGQLTGYYGDDPTLARDQMEANNAYQNALLALREGDSEEARRQFDIAEGFRQRMDTARMQFDIQRDPVDFTSKLFGLSGQESPYPETDLSEDLNPYDPQVNPRGLLGTATGAPRTPGIPRIVGRGGASDMGGPGAEWDTDTFSGGVWHGGPGLEQPDMRPRNPQEWEDVGNQMREGTLKPLTPPGYVNPSFPQGISEEQYQTLDLPRTSQELQAAGFTFNEQTGVMSAPESVTRGLAERARQRLYPTIAGRA